MDGPVHSFSGKIENSRRLDEEIPGIIMAKMGKLSPLRLRLFCPLLYLIKSLVENKR